MICALCHYLNACNRLRETAFSIRFEGVTIGVRSTECIYINIYLESIFANFDPTVLLEVPLCVSFGNRKSYFLFLAQFCSSPRLGKSFGTV